MERKNTKAGVLIWTPAPTHNSPSSTEASDDVWEGEEEQSEEEEEFSSKMDENGIIGLSEALEDVEVGEPPRDADPEFDAGRSSGSTKEAEPSGRMSETSPGEVKYSHTASPSGDLQESTSLYNMNGCTEEEGEDEEEEEEGERIDRNGYQHKHTYVKPTGDSNHKLSPSSAPALSDLQHFTAEELAHSPGIDAEIFPDISFSQSLSESQRSHKSFKSRLPCAKLKRRAPLRLPETDRSCDDSELSYGDEKRSEKSDEHHQLPLSSPRNTKTQSPKAGCIKTLSSSPPSLNFVKSKQKNTCPDRKGGAPRNRGSSTELDESRKATVNHHTPDLSKVEHKVNFPKDGYKPPKSRQSVCTEPLFPEAPLVFKSPAEIVKEVLLNTAEEPLSPSTIAAISTTPQDFRSRQQATTLLEQLQEDYNKLLTKYAAAENTIDRLRLEAKVHLYSDPPKAGHFALSGLNHHAINVLKLEFPQAQKAQIDSASLPPNQHSNHQGSSATCQSARSPAPQLGQQLTAIIYSQADKFFQQLQTFQNLLKSGRLKRFEKTEGFSRLLEGLDSLERGYLLTKDEHKLLQQRGIEVSQFDPERELEGLVFQCGLQMEELKEQVGPMIQREPVCEAPPSPPPRPIHTSTPRERGKALTQAQSPFTPLLDGPGDAARVKMSSSCKESDEKETRDEETPDSAYLKPPTGTHKSASEDFPLPLDQDQSFKDLPRIRVQSPRKEVPLTAPSPSHSEHGDDNRSQGQRSGNSEDQKTPLQSRVQSELQDSSISASKHLRSSPPRCSSASSRPDTLTDPRPRSRRRLEKGRSHSRSVSSLGDTAASQKRSSTVHSCSGRRLSQDRIISPETDSGFVGSEGSHLTLPAALNFTHQRAPESGPVSPVGTLDRPHACICASLRPSSSPSHGRTAREPIEALAAPRFSLYQPRRSRQGPRRSTYSSSPQRWTAIQSDSSEQIDRYTESFNSLHSSLLSSPSSSSLIGRHHHGDLRALSLSLVPNCNGAIQSLQAEIVKLKERIVSGQMSSAPQSPVKTPPAAQGSSPHHSTLTPHISSAGQHDHISEARKEALVTDDSDESTLKPTITKRPSSAPRLKPQHGVLTRCKWSTVQPPQPHVSRSTQTSDSCCTHEAVFSFFEQPTVVPVHAPGPADEADSKRRGGAHSSHHQSRRSRRAERPHGGDKEPSPSVTGHLLYGCTEPDSAAHQSSESLSRTTRGRHVAVAGAMDADAVDAAAAAPPVMLHALPVCSPPLLLYAPTLYIPPPNSCPDSPSEVKGREEQRIKTRRSLSVDEESSSMDKDMNKAIRAARQMKHTSSHMAKCLASGLQHQELFTQSCSY